MLGQAERHGVSSYEAVRTAEGRTRIVGITSFQRIFMTRLYVCVQVSSSTA